MSRARRPPLWVRPFLWAARVLLRTYPPEVAAAIGADVLLALCGRIETCAERAGIGPAFWVGVVELADLALSGFEARRELAGGVRLGAPGYVGVDPLAVLRTLAHDIADAARGLTRSPGRAWMVVGLIAVGVGASASIFGIIDDVLIEPLPFEDSDRLVHVWADRPWLEEGRGLLADVQVLDLERNAETLEGVAGMWMVSGRVLGGARPAHEDVARVSADFFDLLGVEPMLGRTFVEGEDLPGAAWVAILTHPAWQRDFGGDPGVVGRTITVGWQQMEVIGVLPPEFRFRVPEELGAHDVPEIWVPWWHARNEEARIGGGMLAAVSRLAPGASLADARAELASFGEREDRAHYGGRGFGYRVERVQDAWVEDTRPALLALGGAVLILFLVAVTNASTLLLTRTQLRWGELGLRRVMGASPARLSRLLALEALLIAVVAGSLGYAASFAGGAALRALAPDELSLVGGVAPDPTVLLFALLGATAAALVAVGAPVLRQWRLEPGSALRGGAGRTRTETRSAARVRGLLVMAQVALSVVLLVASGLLVRTFASVRGADLGFSESDRVSFNVYLMNEYAHDERVAFYDELRARLLAIDGVLAASGTSALPLSGGTPQLPVSSFRREVDVDPDAFFLTEGFSVLGAQFLEGSEGDGWALVDVAAAHPGYFETIGARVLSGRSIDARDGLGAPLTVVIDDGLAEHLWAGTDAVGQKLWAAGAWREVVGVVAHTRMHDVRARPRPQAYLPHSQVQSGRVSMVVHSDRELDGLVEEIREAVAAIDPLVPIADVATVERRLGEAEARDRFGSTVMAAFAVLAMLLVAMGLYGNLSFAVGERLREIAVRRAVGCGPIEVAAMVLRVGFRTAGGGLLIGVAAAALAGRLLEPLLYGVTPNDPATYSVTVLLVVLVALAASWHPMRRAMSADPVAALRAG